MEERRIRDFADALFIAEQGRIQIAPLTEQDEGLTVEDAYAIQLYNVERVVGMGHKVSGKKIGLTSEGIQRQFGVNEPDYGHLFAAMDCPDGIVDTTQLIQPKIEAEIAFVLSADLTGGKVTVDDVKRATEYVVGSFEIVDSRLTDWRIKLIDTVADNASTGRYVLGATRFAIDEVNLPAVTMKLFKNGELVQEGRGAAVLGDPCAAVAWLANRLWSFGVPLKKGEIILSGAFSAALVAARGDVFSVEFSSFGNVQAEFV